MVFLIFVLLGIVLCCLIGDHSRQMQDAEMMAELYRLEYHHVYPTSN